MKSYWNNKEAAQYAKNDLQLRAYSSRILGQNPDLVLHGGGNTSVKIIEKDFFGDKQNMLYVKGSGWDLIDIQPAGFAPVRMDALLKMAKIKELTDADMVKHQRAAMSNPDAPTPSVEAILHAIIPFQFVDHTHADAVVSITNTPNGEKKIQDIFGSDVLIIPYVMPGFILAKTVYKITQKANWNKLKGLILMNHGIFTFANSAKTSYENMISLVNKAEKYLKTNNAYKFAKAKSNKDLRLLSAIRQAVSKEKGSAVLASLNSNSKAAGFSIIPNIKTLASQGPLTPDHVIRTKPFPAFFNNNPEKNVTDFSAQYAKYFSNNQTGEKSLNSAPKWGIWPNFGTIAFGATPTETQIISDITEHTIAAIQNAENIDKWKALPQKDIFDVEYWELEQIKLKKKSIIPEFQGKIVLVSGAAGGIGKACAKMFMSKGAVVCALDINPKIQTMFNDEVSLGICCDLTKANEIRKTIEKTVRTFGGIDIIVSNAGIFTPSTKIADMDLKLWQKSLNINLTAHQVLMKESIPYLKNGIDPAFIIIGSKNVGAPGKEASAYSSAKAGLTQLARVAALELGEFGIRVNTVHPNQVFDTEIWTDKILKQRAQSYGMTIHEYKTNNILQTEIDSMDVANLVCTLAGKVFSKTTGAQIPIDGGNDRII